MRMEVGGCNNRVAGNDFYELHLTPEAARALAEQLLHAQSTQAHSVCLSIGNDDQWEVRNVPPHARSLEELLESRDKLIPLQRWARKQSLFGKGKRLLFLIIFLAILTLIGVATHTQYVLESFWFPFTPLFFGGSMTLVIWIFRHQIAAADEYFRSVSAELQAVEREIAKRKMLEGLR